MGSYFLVGPLVAVGVLGGLLEVLASFALPAPRGEEPSVLVEARSGSSLSLLDDGGGGGGAGGGPSWAQRMRTAFVMSIEHEPQ